MPDGVVADELGQDNFVCRKTSENNRARLDRIFQSYTSAQPWAMPQALCGGLGDSPNCAFLISNPSQKPAALKLPHRAKSYKINLLNPGAGELLKVCTT